MSRAAPAGLAAHHPERRQHQEHEENELHDGIVRTHGATILPYLRDPTSGIQSSILPL